MTPDASTSGRRRVPLVVQDPSVVYQRDPAVPPRFGPEWPFRRRAYLRDHVEEYEWRAAAQTRWPGASPLGADAAAQDRDMWALARCGVTIRRMTVPRRRLIRAVLAAGCVFPAIARCLLQ